LPSTLLLVIEEGASPLRVFVESEHYDFERDIMVEWPSEGLLVSRESEAQTAGHLPTLILTAFIALLLHVAVGFVWIREHKLARNLSSSQNAEPSTDGAASSGLVT
jgi:hypothetical protein